ncbi:MAG: permease-like cell division protein FtsX [Muribaculaceae bacterium]|nr:permease-like cell division protein FtsX [Muribaculaceae bacterium]
MENKEVKISFLASHLTTIVSVTLVLILVGIISLVWVGAENETRRLREQVELSAVMADSVSDARAKEIGHQLAREPYSRKVRVISKAKALEYWNRQTGEDLKALYGVNPLSPEVTFALKADWNTSTRLDSIRKVLLTIDGVESVDAPDSDVVEAMNSNIAGLTLILAVIAVVMLVISFVLINNTVQLTIYSRRFTIHTMQLVGATNAFIARPVVMSNALCGLVAGILSALIISGCLAGAPHAGVGNPIASLGWQMLLVIAGGLILLGILLCSLSAWIATARYLRKDYSELFR